ncbi:MAG: AMP-binding protein [Alphaproteobacteria bacterium]|nr:AMP-binding protein [Alphaproteobacteria bacterium]
MTQSYVQEFPLRLAGFLEHAAKWRPDAGVVTATGRGTTARIRYRDLLQASRRFSTALRRFSVGAGDRVATLAWNTQAHAEAWYGIAGMGAVVHTLNPRLSPDTLGSMARQAEDRVLVVSASLASLGAELAKLAPSIERLIVIDEALDLGALDAPVPVSLHGEMADYPPGEWGGDDENAPATLCFTSGTTGEPKGVIYTHRSSYLHTLRLLQAEVIGPTAADRILMVVPMFHANGWGLQFAAPAAGASLILPGRHSDGESLASLIRTEGVTVAAGVPTVWLGLIDHIDQTGEDLPTLKRIIVGGAPMGSQLMERIERRLGAIVQTSWGMTELTPLGTIAPADLPCRDAASAGRVAVGVDLLLKDENGRPLPDQREAEGRLHIKGQSVVNRYYGQSEPAVDAEGWFDTGDLARIGEDGSLFITGRAKDLIKSGGEWINPAEIESIVGASPLVSQVAVIARLDPKWGERPILIVEMADNATATDDQLVQRLRGRVPSWWAPDAVIRVAAMPLAATGKIDKQKLRDAFGQGEEAPGARQLPETEN